MMFGGMILVWIVLLVGGYFLIQNIVESNRRVATHSDDPLTILKNRYAKGEIGREEYERMKNDLANTQSGRS